MEAPGSALGVWFGLAGFLVSGPALGLEIGRRNARDAHRFAGAFGFGLLRGASFGVAGWLALDAQFGISFGILSAIGFVAAYVMVGPLPADIDSGQPRIHKAVLKRAVFRGASLGLAAVLSGALHKEPHALSYGVEVGWVTGVSSGFLVAVSPSIEAWVDNLPDRRLGGYGAILVLIGSLFQAVQYVIPLFGPPSR